ncbi:hypothetical protein Tco_0751987 [Tanacetum coccineum]|uniref:Uncharacterized protein n=1 Tax=Tanacetum coccineum TaxID=301880 RepID=A0ABQ4Z6U5_9ASTR
MRTSKHGKSNTSVLEDPTALELVVKPCQRDSLNLPDHRYKQRCCSLIPAELDSLPHAHAQTTKTYYKHQESSSIKDKDFRKL